MKRSPSFQQDIDEAIKGEFGWWFAAVFEAFEFLGGFGYRPVMTTGLVIVTV